MAVYTHVPSETLAAFLARFEVGELVSARGIAEGVENSNYLVDTTRGRFILTLYEKRVAIDDLPFFHALTDHLAAKGNPVPRMIADRAGAWLHALAGRPACLIEFLAGVSITTPTPAQARAAGAALGRMHAGLADFTLERPNRLGVDSWRPLLDRCGTDLDRIAPRLHRDLSLALDEVLCCWPEGQTFADTGEPAGPPLPVCAIHADLFPDNVLIRGDEVSGLIDFYFACTDLRAYDLAVTHTAWTFDASGAPLDPAIGRALIAGYRSAADLRAEERRALWVLAKGACIRFALTRAWDWLNTPADALVTRKDPLAYMRRLAWYADLDNAAAAFA